MTSHSYRRVGMTLVELLVVVAILGLLAVTVLPNLAASTEARRSKETARVVTSFIAQSQAKALGQPTPTGFGMIKTGDASIDLVPASVPPAYCGDTPNARVGCLFSAGPPPSLVLSFTNAFTTGTWMSCTSGDLIRFDNRGPWYLVSAATSGTSCTLRSGTSTIDSLAGQTEFNTAWPSTAVGHSFELLRRPQPSGSKLSLGDGRCIDTYWSSASQPGFDCLGDNTAILPADTVYVLFDASGQVRQVVAGANRFAPAGPILLLVGRVDRAGQAWALLSASDDAVGANWQYADSIWIAVDPISGVCKTAECDAAAAAQSPPNGLTPAQQTSWRLRESQNVIRSSLLIGSR